MYKNTEHHFRNAIQRFHPYSQNMSRFRGGKELNRQLRPFRPFKRQLGIWWVLLVLAVIAVNHFIPKTPDIQGAVTVLDGDTLDLKGQRIRLAGIDAPELGQQCTKDHERYPCGKESAWVLQGLIKGQEIGCISEGKDKYNRTLSTCYLGDKNINAEMVRLGWALAYSHYSEAYVSEENIARTAKVGLWEGTFQTPWDYRHK